MKENLSAGMDGELSGPQVRTLLTQLKSDEELRGNWDCYHLIGDVLRGTHGPELCAKICARLESEPTVLAPRRRSEAQKLSWYGLSAAASIAAVVFVGWIALSGTGQVAPQVAAVSAPVAETRPAGAMAGEGARDYLLAHQRYSPSSAMQGVAPYVRTVADERSASRR
jgi:sigma-E factor negative regulatory protein RseA